MMMESSETRPYRSLALYSSETQFTNMWEGLKRNPEHSGARIASNCLHIPTHIHVTTVRTSMDIDIDIDIDLRYRYSYRYEYE